MDQPPQGKFHQRVIQAADAVLAREKTIGPLELFQEMSVLHFAHVKNWRAGHPQYASLEQWIQLGPEKFAKAIRYFQEWVLAHGLRPMEANYLRLTPRGPEPLRVTADGDPEREKFFRTHYAAPQASTRQAKQIKKKLSKVPDLVVFELIGKDAKCAECGRELTRGNFLFMEKSQPLCLACADLDHLVFLPSGDATLSRRARKHSPLSAIVVRFSRSRGRYERQGILVTPGAIDQAMLECEADAGKRAIMRVAGALRRENEDRVLVADMTRTILKAYPHCPPEEAGLIAAHTAERGSGRVGRSAEGRALDEHAIGLAVQAWIRHQHTNYDPLLMQGVERLEARQMVRAEIEGVLAKWKGQA